MALQLQSLIDVNRVVIDEIMTRSFNLVIR